MISTYYQKLKADMERLPEEEIRKISLQRNQTNKCYTSEALLAQNILHERSGCFQDYQRGNIPYICAEDGSICKVIGNI